jgi:acyl-CoA oxidase
MSEDPRYPTPLRTISADLAAERSSTPFTPLHITHFLDGSPTATSQRRRLESWIIRDPTGIFSNENNAYMHRTERHTRALAKFVRLIELCRSAGIGSKQTTSDGQSSIQHLEGEIVSSPEFYTLVSSLADDPLPPSLHWVRLHIES